jgi:hypothetical protein
MSRSAAVITGLSCAAARPEMWLREDWPQGVLCLLMSADSLPVGQPNAGGQPRAPPPDAKRRWAGVQPAQRQAIKRQMIVMTMLTSPWLHVSPGSWASCQHESAPIPGLHPGPAPVVNTTRNRPCSLSKPPRTAQAQLNHF